MSDFFSIKKCFNCHNALCDLEKLESKLQKVMQKQNFNSRLKERLNTEKPMHHQLFHIALAGCPNSCSQPQIKDFGVQGQVVPKVGEGCTGCMECIKVCQEGAIILYSEGIDIDREACINCGQCIRSCPEGVIKSGKTGFRVLAGGKLGRHPRLATELSLLAGEDQVPRCLNKCIEFFFREGRPGERLGSIMARKGDIVF